MPPAKKATSANKRSKVMGGAEDEVITDPTPAEAHDPELSSRAKDELFGDPPKDVDGIRPNQEGVTATKPDDAVETPPADLTPPERHEHSAHESADAVEDDADYDAEEVEAKP